MSMNDANAQAGSARAAQFLDDADGNPPPAARAWDRTDTIPWQRDLLVLFLRNQLRVWPAMPILALLLALTSMQWVPWYVSAGWLLTALACQAIQLYLCHDYFRSERSHDEQRDWISMLSASELLTGVCWSLPLFLFWNSAGSMQQVYLIASVMAVIAGPAADRQQFHAGAGGRHRRSDGRRGAALRLGSRAHLPGARRHHHRP